MRSIDSGGYLFVPFHAELIGIKTFDFTFAIITDRCSMLTKRRFLEGLFVSDISEFTKPVLPHFNT